MSEDLLEGAKKAWKQGLPRRQEAHCRKAVAVSETLANLGYSNSTGVLTEDALFQDIHLDGEVTCLRSVSAAASLANLCMLNGMSLWFTRAKSARDASCASRRCGACQCLLRE